jgi:hypothetical protein
MAKSFRITLLLAGLVAVSLVASHGAAASQAQAPRGITVTPAFQQVEISSSETEHPVSFTITNNEPSAQTINLSAADFNTLNETGGLLFVGTNPTALQKKYGLAKWLGLDQQQITLAPKQTAAVQAKVLNLPDLKPGGHYGALMLALNNASSGNRKNNVALHPIASSLLFVTKLGGDTHKLGLQAVDIKRSIFSLPGSVTLRFHNDGNTHVVPRGSVRLIDSNGTLLRKGVINENSSIILPETSRLYYVPLKQITSSSRLGHYIIKVDFRFDGTSQFRSFLKNLIYIPLGKIVSFLVLLAAAGWLVRNALIVKRKPKNKNK